MSGTAILYNDVLLHISFEKFCTASPSICQKLFTEHIKIANQINVLNCECEI